MKDKDLFLESMLDVKKARLVEHHLTFEQLKFCNDFDDEEAST